MLLENAAEENMAPTEILGQNEETSSTKFKQLVEDDEDDDTTNGGKKKAKTGDIEIETIRGSTDVIDAFNKKYGATSKGRSNYSKTRDYTTSTTPTSYKSSKKSASPTSSTSPTKSPTSPTGTLRLPTFNVDKPGTKAYKPTAANDLRKKHEKRKRDAKAALGRDQPV